VYGCRTSDALCTAFAKTDSAEFAGFDVLSQGFDGLLDRCFWVYASALEEIERFLAGEEAEHVVDAVADSGCGAIGTVLGRVETAWEESVGGVEVELRKSTFDGKDDLGGICRVLFEVGREEL
jgi:hypothetical protein